MNSIELGLFASRLEAVCSEMGTVLQQAAFSPNICDHQGWDYYETLGSGMGASVAGGDLSHILWLYKDKKYNNK